MVLTEDEFKAIQKYNRPKFDKIKLLLKKHGVISDLVKIIFTYANPIITCDDSKNYPGNMWGYGYTTYTIGKYDNKLADIIEEMYGKRIHISYMIGVHICSQVARNYYTGGYIYTFYDNQGKYEKDYLYDSQSPYQLTIFDNKIWVDKN